VDYAYKRISNGAFESVSKDVERAIDAHGFIVSGIHDVHVTLAAKGFHIRPLRIYEVREPRDRYVPAGPGSVAQDPRSTLVMPCKINVFEEGDRIAVAAILPSIMRKVYPEAQLDGIVEDIEDRVVRIVDDATDAKGRPARSAAQAEPPSTA
jgi:uncharacterized protein (DUF302 family)